MRWTDDRRQWRCSNAGAVKKKSKKSTSVLTLSLNLLILCVVVIVVAIYFFMSPRFPIRHVAVEHGRAFIDENVIRNRVTPHLQHGFFYTQVKGIQEDLLQLPWIKTAVVEKTWPDRLVIKLSVREAVAKWNKNAYLLDNGVVYHAKAPLTAAVLPELNSLEENGPVLLELYYAFKADLNTVALSIQDLNETSGREYVVFLNNGIVLNLGEKDLQRRLHRFVKAYPVELADKVNRIAYVDLRYENGMAVGWRNDEKVNAATSKLKNV